MVTNTRKALGAHALRPLGVSNALTVEAGTHGQPRSVQKPAWNAPRRVLGIQDAWRIDDEWWRDRPIARRYFCVQMEGDLLVTLYHDLAIDAWFEQRG